jgi:glyoxylase-like metal-dependent hydrolase (beta-lactamase superfamily II)
MNGGTVPPVEQVRDGLWAVAVPMPGGARYLGYSFCYLILDDDGRLHVVDPGWDSPENRALLERAVRGIVTDVQIASVIVTHLHQDHIGLAEHLRRETGAPIVLHEREDEAIGVLSESPQPPLADWGVPPAAVDELAALRTTTGAVPDAPHGDLLLRGEVDLLTIRGLDIEAIRTPGHTPGSVCLRIRGAGVLLTGDTVLPVIHPGLGLGGRTASNPIADYLDSLDRLAGDDALEVLPGHGYRFTGLRERTTGLAEHHLRRTREVAAALQATPDASVWEIAATLTWTAGWEKMHGFFLYSALSQTALHIDYLNRSALVPSAADRLEGRA